MAKPKSKIEDLISLLETGEISKDELLNAMQKVPSLNSPESNAVQSKKNLLERIF